MFCFDINESGILQSAVCHSAQGNQYFRYDMITQQIFHSSKRQSACIDHNPENPAEGFTVFIANCDENSETQRWKWGYVNETAIENWIKYGTEIIDQNEIKDLS